MQKSIFWYDLETTGTDPARDRAIQFAGVRTDLDLVAIDKPVNLYCYPGNDVIPSPEAMLVTGLSMSELARTGLTETAFIGRIHSEFARPGTCVAGFNSIRFDDEFVRNLLYRNFLDPYAREWQNQNSRWDVIDLFRMAQALRPEGLDWPANDDGHPTFKLEAMTAANGISHEGAHDAAQDVLATVALVNKLRVAQPRLFKYFFDLRGKKEVVKQLYPLGKTPVVHISSMYSAAKNCIAVVLPLCTHPTNPNGIVCYDLAFDPGELIEMGPDELHRRLFTSQAALAEGEERVHLKTVHVNRCPAVAPVSTLTPAVARRLGLDLDRCEQHKASLQHASGTVEKIQEAMGKSNFPQTADPDLMLYQGGFFSNSDRAAMLELRGSNERELAGYNGGFDDARVSEMLFRFRARNYPDSLDPTEQARWDEYRRDVASTDGRLAGVLAQIDELVLAGRDRECLQNLAAYLRSTFNGLAP